MRRNAADIWAATRPVVTLALVALNVAVFAAMVWSSGTTSPPADVLERAGALTSATLQTGQYWRLVAAGFLHANLIHLFGNMQMLLVCGPALERRLGRTAFTVVYAAALVGGGLASLLVHRTSYVGVGASGAIFGLLGALFAFWVMGRQIVPGGFLLANLGLNVALTVLIPFIDWAAHLGGFATGMASVALLGLWTSIARLMLRCRFPEFVAANALLLVAAGAVQRWMFPVRLLGLAPGLVGIVSWAAGALAFVKLLDLLLATRRGLAGVVVLLAACNGLAVYAACALLRPAPGWAPAAAAAGGVLTLLLHVRSLVRGLRDVGFVGAGLAVERRRRSAL